MEGKITFFGEKDLKDFSYRLFISDYNLKINISSRINSLKGVNNINLFF
jgi:hypothetical protein